MRQAKIKNNPRWYALDNAAKIYPAVMNPDWGAVFRLSCTIDEEVDPVALDAALVRAMKRFPMFAVSLRRGLFWFYHETLDGHPLVRPESGTICAMPEANDNAAFLFRLLYYHHRISLEIFHSLADGGGALAFLKTIVACYFDLCGLPLVEGEGVLDPGTAASPEESEDAFARYATKAGGGSFSEGRSYVLPDRILQPPALKIVVGVMDVGELAAAAKSRSTTITGLLAATLMLAYDAVQREEEGIPQLPIKIQVPINLRKIFPSRTLRNFSLYANVALPISEHEPSLDEAIAACMEGMRRGHEPGALARMMSLNVAAERLPALRPLPLILKETALKAAYSLVGDSQFTCALSNLGAVTLPQPLAARVRRFDFALGRARIAGVNCGVASYDGKMVVTMTRNIARAAVERVFFTGLARLGIGITVESN